MHTIPVMDLQGGLVVRGVAGRRDEYRAVVSKIADQARPSSVAAAFASLPGCERIYVADLDAIAGRPIAQQSLREIAVCGPRLLLDAGIGDGESARRLVELESLAATLDGVVVGLESLRPGASLESLVETIGPERAVFSIDLHDGQPRCNTPPWRSMTPGSIAEEAVRSGFRRLIALDLARVGVNTGPSLQSLCRSIRRAHGGIELISGGGVRGVGDVQTLIESGCDAVLVASALHDGRITAADLAALHRIATDPLRSPQRTQQQSPLGSVGD